MSNRIDRLEARVQALSAQTAPAVLLIETENGSQRMTVSQYNAAGGMLAILDDIPGVVVHGVLRCAEALLHLVPGVALLRGQIVVDSLDRGLGLAAAVCQLCSQSILPLHQRNVGAVEALLHGVGDAVQALLHAVEALKHPGVHGIDAITQAVFQPVQFIHDALVVEATLQVCLCDSAGHIRRSTAHAHAAAPAKAAHAAPAEHAENQKEDDPAHPVAAPAVEAVAVAVGGLYRHGQNRAIRRKRHSFTPLR